MPSKITVVRERLTAFMLVFMAGVPMAFASFLVAFGNQIEPWTVYQAGHDFSAYILGVSTALRWIIATLTSIAVIALVYHHGVPRTRPGIGYCRERFWLRSCGFWRLFCSVPT